MYRTITRALRTRRSRPIGHHEFTVNVRGEWASGRCSRQSGPVEDEDRKYEQNCKLASAQAPSWPGS